MDETEAADVCIIILLINTYFLDHVIMLIISIQDNCCMLADYKVSTAYMHDYAK